MERKQKFNLLVGQSGGPTAVINASLYGVLREALGHTDYIDQVYGMVHGVEGFMEGDYVNLSELAQTERMEYLRQTPSAYLGSCRFKLPADLDDPFYPRLFEKLNILNIKIFLYIGGNDSMDTVAKLHAYGERTGSDLRFIGIPKTIDNDLVQTDHTPGYGSTAKYVATTVREIVLDASVYKHPVVTIVELMGRHAGWVTAASVLARTRANPNPLLIYLPETVFSVESFLADLKRCFEHAISIVVCVSEGIADKNGKLICEYGAEATTDGFGHKMLAGCGKVLENIVRQNFNCKCRSIELNLPQRCSGVLAAQTDIDEAEGAGAYGVLSALNRHSGKMVAIERVRPGSEDGSEPIRRGPLSGYYTDFSLVDVSEVCNREKKFPSEWITAQGSDIAEAFIDYALPLIQGESQPRYKDGLPEYMQL